MADEATHIWIVAQFLSAVAVDSRDADLLEAAQRSRAECQPTYSADAEGADPDECAVGERVERYQRSHGAGHHQGHSRRRTRPPQAGSVPRLPGAGERGADCAESRRQLATRFAVPAKAGAEGL